MTHQRPKRLRVNRRSGFSLVEILVAMVILTIGLLGLAAGTGWMIRAVDLARLETVRTAAMQSVIEEMRAIPLAALQDGSRTVGEHSVSWTVLTRTANSAEVRVILVGPGRAAGSYGPRPAISMAAADTLIYRRSR